MSNQRHIWLRAEDKGDEKRTPLVPEDAKRLIDSGFKITVERCDQRSFLEADYEAVGCELVTNASWPKAPKQAYVLGLKELPDSDTELVHRHIYFAHAYKQQVGWQKLLKRFQAGGGVLLDMEYLVDDNHRRVATFGYYAGFAGCAVAVDLWCHQQTVGGNQPYPKIEAKDEATLLKELNQKLNQQARMPRTLIIGANGRSGKGAIALLNRLELNSTGWNRRATRTFGPFKEILNFDIFINCVLVEKKIPPFLTPATLEGRRQLSVICDVSCDPTGPFNSLPIYDKTTSFAEPAKRLIDRPPLDIIAIDHLPSMLPKRSSESFSAELLPHLLQLESGSGVWRRAEQLFESKLAEANEN